MCGISGFASLSSNDPLLIVQMTKPIRHRGPDDEGYVLFKDYKSSPIICGGSDTPIEAYSRGWDYSPGQSIGSLSAKSVIMAFGHRRLSIVDLSPLGHQPMSYANARYWITYNGEIYNYLELRTELESLGHQFLSHTDTEVLLASYAQWGTGCLPRLNGMWSFAIYDRFESTFFISRDRFGVKPLYYWVSPNHLFAFASEIKQFINLPRWNAKINPQRAYDFLVFGLTDHTNETLFDGVFQLKPGHFIKFDLRQLSELVPNSAVSSEAWYRLTSTPYSGSFEDACVSFRQTLTDSIKLRMRADVSIGSCLSGGLDSSSIVCVVNGLLSRKNNSARQKTFSAYTDVERFNERKWIDIVVKKTGVDAYYVDPSLDNLFKESELITWHQDEPFGSTSIYAQWNVFKLASQANVKVMLDGQGADEQLAGYHGFFGARLSGLFKDIRWLELLREATAMKQNHGYSLFTSSMFLANHLLPYGIANALKMITSHNHAKPSWLKVHKLGAEPMDPKYTTGAREGSLTKLSISQLTASGLQMLLHWEDRNSMAHAIESRVPFLDFRLVELVVGFPDEYKLYRGVTKRVLRHSMQGILPESIANRMDKLGFATPEEVWLRERAPDLWRAKVNEGIDRTHDIIDREFFNIYLDKMINGTIAFSFQPWRVISFGQWMDQFNVVI